VFGDLFLHSQCRLCASLEETLAQSYPWCDEWEAELKRFFASYVAAKQRDRVLDYDDLLLYWREAVEIPGIAAQMRRAWESSVDFLSFPIGRGGTLPLIVDNPLANG
jgi:hypothetical protein